MIHLHTHTQKSVSNAGSMESFWGEGEFLIYTIQWLFPALLGGLPGSLCFSWPASGLLIMGLVVTTSPLWVWTLAWFECLFVHAAPLGWILWVRFPVLYFHTRAYHCDLMWSVALTTGSEKYLLSRDAQMYDLLDAVPPMEPWAGSPKTWVMDRALPWASRRVRASGKKHSSSQDLMFSHF